jgi:capsular exopolysaccharide synthesis family protein
LNAPERESEDEMSRIGDALWRARAAADAITPVDDEKSPGWMRPVREDAREAPWAFEKNGTPAEPPPARPTRGARESVPSAPSGRPAVADSRGHGILAVFRGVNPSIEDRVVSGNAPSVGVEQYRRLAALLHHAQIDKGVNVVMITSAVAGEGKSLTSTNLALTISQSYRRRVLLVDADLRSPSLHETFQVAGASGLSEGLRRSDAQPFPMLEIADTLALLPAGRPDPDPMSSLTSPRMKQLVQEARSKFDWVIIDTPPVALMPDANLLASMADGVLLVVGAAQAPYDIIKKAAETLGPRRIIGVVLNRAETSTTGDYGYDRRYTRGS